MAIPVNARILIVEDEAFISLMLQDMMRDLGLVVAGTASSLEEALAAVEGPDQFDLASLDINLHGHISEPVATALDARGIPFIVTTGYDDRCLAPAFQDRPRVEKPFQLDDLGQALEALGLS
jgi:CheY-like chemotaxis protein